MKKSVGVAFGFVGTVIGAGFASGKEITLYFSETGLLTPILSAVFLGVFAYFFCEIGRTTDGNGYALFGKGNKVVSVVVKAACALVFCTAVAASEEAVFKLFGIRGGAIITVLLTLITLFTNKKVAAFISILSVLIIVALLGALFFRTETSYPYGKFSPLSSLLYAGMNMLSGGFFIAQKSKDMTKKESQACAAISFVLLTVLLLVVFLLCKTRENAVFPVLAAAEEAGLGKIGLVIIYLALFTTCNGTCSVASGEKLSYALLLGCIALPVSCFGFETLIAKIYPAIGTAGCIVSIGAIALYLYKTKTGRKSRGRGNDLDVLVTDNADKSVL